MCALLTTGRLCVSEDVLKRYSVCKCDILRSSEIYPRVQKTYSDEYTLSAKKEEAVVLRVF